MNYQDNIDEGYKIPIEFNLTTYTRLIRLFDEAFFSSAVEDIKEGKVDVENACKVMGGELERSVISLISSGNKLYSYCNSMEDSRMYESAREGLIQSMANLDDYKRMAEDMKINSKNRFLSN